MGHNLLVVKIDDKTKGVLASIKDLYFDESWKDQIGDLAFAILKDGICAGAGRNYRFDKCIVDRFISQYLFPNGTPSQKRLLS